jgi:hypothetical protein
LGTPAPDKAFQPFWLGEAHEIVGVLDDNSGGNPRLKICLESNPVV